MPLLPRDAWKSISFYAYLPFDLIANAPLGHALTIINVVLVPLGLLGVDTRLTLGLAAPCRLTRSAAPTPASWGSPRRREPHCGCGGRGLPSVAG